MIAVSRKISECKFIRRNSSRCWNRFSNTVSIMVDSPFATAINAVNWACMSVGKPGCGKVFTVTGLSFSTCERTRIPSASSVTSTPISIILEISGRLCSQTASLIKTSPPVIAAATINVPASIRS